MRKILTFVLIGLVSAYSYAQQTGSIVGQLTDKDFNDEPLAFANVIIKGTSKGTTSDIDGLYALENMAVGTYTVVFSFVGYETVEIENITVEANKVTTVNVPMGASAAALDEVIIKTTTRRESEVALLLEQKKSITQKVSIGADELSRKGVGDVATAVTKVTGISKQEGSSNVFVRGLGDRYNVTTLNGLPLPSDNPFNKNIDLGIFSTDIVENIGIDKTYNPQNYGDFGGANIDITSKDYQGTGFMEIGLESGVNTEAIAVDDFYLTDGPNRSGFYNINYPDFPLNNYNFTTSWDRQRTVMPLNSGLTLRGGESFFVGEETKISLFGVGSYSNQHRYQEGVSRGGVQVSAVPRSDFDYTNFSYNTNTTLMGNAGVKFGGQKLQYSGFYLNTSSEEQQEFNGVIDVFDDGAQGGGFVQRSVFKRTQLFTHQLLGTHELGEQFEIDWGGSYNYLESTEPNRRQVTLVPEDQNEPDGPKSFALVSAASSNHRFYATLEEEELAGNFALSFKFNKNEDEDYLGKVTVGYSGRFKNVDFEATQFNFRIAFGNGINQPQVDPYNVDAYFNQQNLDAGLFVIQTFRGGVDLPNALDPQTYGGDQSINAGFLNFEYAFSPKFSMLAGVRAEQINQTLDYNTIIAVGESELDTFEVLPSLSLKYSPNDKQNFKFAASKTYTLPQYKERAPFLYQEVNQDYFGNPFLEASTNYNVDAKWELFPKNDEIISIGLLGKLIQNPINQITVQSAANDISWANTGDQATAFGAELDLRKNLFEIEKEVKETTLKNSLSAGFNAAYMITDQELDGEKVLEESGLSFDPTYSNTGISGASDLVANADVTYYTDFSEFKNLQLTLAGNYFSDRIFALGSFGKGNIIEKGIPTLDFVAKAQLTENISMGLTANNLLNPTVSRFQEAVDGDISASITDGVQEEDVDVLSFKKGYFFKLSFAYNF